MSVDDLGISPPPQGTTVAGQRRHAGLAPPRWTSPPGSVGPSAIAAARGRRRIADACDRHGCAPAAPQVTDQSRVKQRGGEKETATSCGSISIYTSEAMA